MKPSQLGVEYLRQIFANAIGYDDVESIRDTLFDLGNLIEPYHSRNLDINRRVQFLK